MVFANPEYLLFLFLIPFLVFVYFFKSKQSTLELPLSGSDVSFSSLLDRVGFYLPFVLRMLVIALIVVMLARPQVGQQFSTSKNKGLDLMVAIDTSGSMSALDLKLGDKAVDRLTVVKSILRDFVQKRSKDRLGLIVFGEHAFTQCPLTTDHGSILDLLNRVEIGMVGGMTAIGSAIAIAVKRLKNLKAKSRVLILMTDGQNTAGAITPMMATDLAIEYDIKIYTIGVGKEGEVPMQVQTPAGPVMTKQLVHIDEETLSQIAEKTGGVYYRAESTEQLKKIYEHIDKLEKTEIEVKNFSSYKDMYETLLWIAFALFSLELLLGNTLLFRLN